MPLPHQFIRAAGPTDLSVPPNPTLKALDVVTEFTRMIPSDPDQRCEADALQIGGDWSPGFCVISKAGIPITWDKRKGYGLTGASLVYVGNELAEFDAEFTIITQAQMVAWKSFAKKYFVMESNATTIAAQNARVTAALKAQAYQLVATAQAVSANANASSQQKLQAEAAAQNASDAATAAASGLNPAFIANPPQPKALGVKNPILAELGITKIVPSNIGGWSQPAIGKMGKGRELHSIPRSAAAGAG